MNPRSEPLLWVQLISLGVLPLELLLLLLVLAGSDPGPLPQLERLLCWALGALAPALLLWRRPADPRSLLLVTAALPPPAAMAATVEQQQRSLVPRLLFGGGVLILLPLLGWMDAHAALAGSFSPLQDGVRLSALLLSAALLALMVWQWHQLVQAGWLLVTAEGRAIGDVPDAATRQDLGLTNPGLPLLLLSPLVFPQPAANRVAVEPQAAVAPPAVVVPAAVEVPAAALDAEAEPTETPGAGVEDSALPVAVEPEQSAEEDERPQLDEQVDGSDLTPGG